MTAIDSEERRDGDEYVLIFTGRPLSIVAHPPATIEPVSKSVSVPSSAPPCAASIAVKSENGKPKTPTFSLKPRAPSVATGSQISVLNPNSLCASLAAPTGHPEDKNRKRPPRTPIDHLVPPRHPELYCTVDSLISHTPFGAHQRRAIRGSPFS